MKFSSRDITWTSNMKEFTETALRKAFQHTNFDYEACEIKVSQVGHDHVNIKVELNGKGFIAQQLGKDFYIVVRKAITKFKNLVVKQNKRQRVNRRSVFEVDPTSSAEGRVLNLVAKEKVFVLTPQSLEHAIEAFECTDYAFYVFVDIDYEQKFSVLYRRANNTLGIIRCSY